MEKIVGREYEIAFMNSIYESDRSEFIAVYGRRRVGKTFLIRNVYNNKISFHLTGVANASLRMQLANFNLQISKTDEAHLYNPAENWLTAFEQLRGYLEKQQGRKLVFIDELPWFDTVRSGFISALEHFWNSWASMRDDVVLIVCGSATSWMVNKLINNNGGLHNRITRRLKLEPFNLYECELYLKEKNIELNKYQLIQLYMAIGGIPYYWNEVQRGLSAQQNIDEMCFSEKGLLQNEFYNLYRSLFKNYQQYIVIVKALATKSKGLSRIDIVRITKLPNGGSSTKALEELEASGFIRRYLPFGKKKKDSLFQLVDFYSHFYLKFINNTKIREGGNWLNIIDTPKFRAWSGYAYEQICLYHLPQIKQALGISGVYTEVSSWRSKKSEPGAQIDLVIDRRDGIINICEFKFSINPFNVNSKYAKELQNKIGVFKYETSTRKAVHLTMLTTYGVVKNANSIGLFQSDYNMEILFDKSR